MEKKVLVTGCFAVFLGMYQGSWCSRCCTGALDYLDFKRISDFGIYEVKFASNIDR
jgi:hypothetical protein